MTDTPQDTLSELISLHNLAQAHGLNNAAAWLRASLDTITAARDTGKLLTPKQRQLLDELRNEVGSWVEVLPEELRTARSLEQRGLIEMNGDYEARYLP